MRVVAGIVSVGFAMGFWCAIDSFGAPHVPFDLFDARSLAGFAAWSCAIFATRIGHYALYGEKKS